MNSPKFLNYETRPLKFTERKMLLASLTRIVNYFKNNYQYIGFGGVAFTDFKLFHKELHIDEMFSIEGGSKISIEKLHFNAPFSFIKVYKKLSTEALVDISLEKKSLIWLDYDGTLDNYFFNDIRSLFSKLPEGSIYIVTCNRELKQKESGEEYTTEQFQEFFGDLVPFQLKNKDFTSKNSHNTLRKMFLSHIENILDERKTTGLSLKFHQLFNILYQENRGAKMYTFGGVITKNDFDINEIDLKGFDFINKDDTTYNLEIPNFTRKEIDLVDSHLLNNEEELLNKKIITESELKKYKKTYKFLPNFFDVRV